jgi:small ligand-binding sensory domain FIST
VAAGALLVEEEEDVEVDEVTELLEAVELEAELDRLLPLVVEMLAVVELPVVVATMLVATELEVADELALDVVTEDAGSREYMSSLPPAPQYCSVLFLQSMLQDEVSVTTEPAPGRLPQ